MSEHVNLENARDPEQLRRMQEHARAGKCHFCPVGFKAHKSPVIWNGQSWFITANDFPYEGTGYHFLIVLKEHRTALTDLLRKDMEELILCAIPFLVEHTKAPGYSIFVRNGKMNYTGATLDHLHIHFVVGAEKSGPQHPMIFAPVGYKK